MTTGGACDAVIIGGGVIGCSVAYFLAAGGASVRVFEPDPSYARASSALSASSIRQQFTSPICMRMSHFGFEFLRDIDTWLGVDGEAVDVGLVERGYLYLADARNAQALAAALDVQQSNGASVAAMSRQDLETAFPWMRTDDLELAAFGQKGEGWFDGYSLLQAFRRKAKAMGVNFIQAEVTGLVTEGARVTGVRLPDETVHCDVVINAAGFRAGEVAAWAGVQIPVGPERRSVFVFDCKTPPPDIPLIIDTSGIYVRPEGSVFIAGGPASPHEAPGPCFEVDHNQFDELIWPALAHRAPAFEAIKLVSAWAGQYEMNFFDHNALIGKAPGVDGFYLVNGFSGHGMQHAPAAGRGLAELILTGRYQSLDLSPLDPERVSRGEPLIELNII